MIRFQRMAPLLMVALVSAPVAPAFAQDRTYEGGHKIHYAKTEVEKAKGKCVGRVIGGTLLGAALGGLLGGKRGVALGAAAGAGAGITLCTVLIANAKHQDAIIQAQLSAARSARGNFTTSWHNDEGQPVTYTARLGQAKTIDGARLVPVRYAGADGSQRNAPVLDTGGRDCRSIDGSFGGSEIATPSQWVCRTPGGDYEPYEEQKS